MITNINHASFTVSDLDRSIAFYRDVLGLRLLNDSERDPVFSEKVTGVKGAHLRIAYFFIDNCSIELVQYVKGEGKKLDTTTSNVGSAHICFNVDNFKDFVKSVERNGGILVAPYQKIPAGPNKGKLMLYAKDPDLNTLEFISNEVYGEDK